jgi:hypothetical protein
MTTSILASKKWYVTPNDERNVFIQPDDGISDTIQLTAVTQI